MGLLTDRAGVVTGAAAGIGRASAIALAAEGAGVVVSDLESQRTGGEETVRMIEATGGRAIFAAVDVTSEDDQRALVARCVDTFGHLDFAHNNAGIALYAALEQTTPAEWDWVIETNVIGTFLGMKHQLAQMRTQRRGSIINTSSGAGVFGFPRLSAYTASKHAVIGLTRTAAQESANAGIRVNAVCPGATRTPPFDALDHEDQLATMIAQAIKRPIEPSEIADAVVWLASDRSSAVTGIPLLVDLGLSAGLLANAEVDSS